MTLILLNSIVLSNSSFTTNVKSILFQLKVKEYYWTIWIYVSLCYVLRAELSPPQIRMLKS